MIRKLLLIGAAAAIPLGGLAVGAIGGGVASALSPVTCTVSSTSTFASPGLSAGGVATASKTSSTKTSGATLGGAGCTGSIPALTIPSKNAKCNPKAKYPPTPACSKTLKYVFDTAAGFASAGSSSLLKAFKHTSSTINGTTYIGQAKTAVVSSTCPGEIGFTVTGKITAPAGTYTGFTLNACLGTDTGTSLASGGASFAIDLGDASGGGPDVIASANIDPSTSTLTLH